MNDEWTCDWCERFLQATLERSETETRQRLTAQIEKQEREIAQLQKRLENEVEQKHLLTRNQDVRDTALFFSLSLLSSFLLIGILAHLHLFDIPLHYRCSWWMLRSSLKHKQPSTTGQENSLVLLNLSLTNWGCRSVVGRAGWCPTQYIQVRDCAHD